MRNKPCFCNSGKKYKKCCGSETAILEFRRLREAKADEERKRLRQERAKANPNGNLSVVRTLAIYAAAMSMSRN